MFVDARNLPADEKLEADICIVGAGPAGIALATALSGSARRIVLAESGGLEFDAAANALNDGQTAGLAYRVNESRQRYFGGAGNTWAGNCRELDPHIFETRDWLPHSAWPLAYSDLKPLYQKARLFLGVAGTAPGVADLRNAGAAPLEWSEPLETAVWQVSPLRPLGERFRPELTDAPGVTVLLNANLVRLACDPEGQSIAGAHFGTLAGGRFTVAARRYVLACGGMENARLLLAMASERHPAGLGNRHDLVGRFFTEHPEIRVGMLVHNRPAPPRRDHVLATGVGDLAEGFRISDRFQQRARIADAAFWPLSIGDVSRSPELAAEHGFLIQDLSTRLAGLSPSGARLYSLITLTIEQSPNPESRITLSDERDALGMRRVRLDWRLNVLDRRTYSTALKLIGREAGRQRMGRFLLSALMRGFDLDCPDTVRFDIPLGRATGSPNRLDTELGWGCHHIGTTRMHRDARFGVVDPDARVHGIANLYVAGSSVFPSGGVSNPTLTIVALALRLAGHLASQTW